ncbi:MAG: PspA/IM30 family protein [Firmicutes bacterium]|nr:PspA/IM30 family protein [Bacillota bacterium]
MSLFKRIGDNIRANINSMLDKAENPIKMLEQYLRDMEDDIADAEVAVTKQIAVVKRFQKQYEDSQVMADKRETQALQALEQEREDLARRALEDKKLHQAKADDYKEQFEGSRETADKLKAQLREMKDEYEQMKAKKATLVARAEAAKAQKEINKVMTGFGKDTARKGFERMEEKVNQAEAEAAASIELKSSGQDLDDELASLGKNNNDVDTELARLKQKLKHHKKE